MATRRLSSTLFLIAGGLFLAAAIRDLFFPTFFPRGHGRPAVSAAVGVVFFVIGMAARRQLRDASNSH